MSEPALWTKAEVCAWLNYKPSTFDAEIRYLEGFPKEMRLWPKADPRWPVAEVKEWFYSKVKVE